LLDDLLQNKNLDLKKNFWGIQLTQSEYF